MGMWDRFDMRFVLSTPQARERRGKFMAEAARVGLCVDVYYNPAVELELIGMQHIPCCRFVLGSIGRVSCNMGHYRIVKTAYEAGARTLLAFEDDVVFMRDLKRIEKSLSELPADFDVALLDTMNRVKTMPEDMRAQMEARRVNGSWTRKPSTLRSLAAYAMSRRGMSWFLSTYDYVFTTKRGKMRVCDSWFDDGRIPVSLKCLCAFPRIAIQSVTNDPMTAAHASNGLLQRYRRLGERPEEYGGMPVKVCA